MFCENFTNTSEYDANKTTVEADTVVKVNKTSSVQDAGNQTETETETETRTERYEFEAEITKTKAQKEENIYQHDNTEVDEDVDVDVEIAVPLKRTKTYCDLSPDFSGLQVLLNGIEQVEHDRSVKIDKEDGTHLTVAADDEESDKEIDKPTPNGLQILCALADQRFLEENEHVKDINMSSTKENGKTKVISRILNSSICKSRGRG